MKKTLTINLNSTVFNIDEDAYEKLQSYLNELRLHLEKDERDEVMQDIEARVGELFGERIGRYKNVISIEDVDKVIETLGTPETFGPITEEKKETSSRSRKFYRSVDNCRIAGVAGGMAALIGWDVKWVRLIFLLLLCASFGWMTLIYVLLWIIVPEARTVAQKLEMQGIEPSLQNISDYSHNNVQMEPVRTDNVVVTLLKVIGTLLLVPMVLLLVLIIVVLVFAFIAVAFSSAHDLLGISALDCNWGIAVAFIVFALASVIIPLVFIIKMIIRAIRHTNRETNRKTFIVWLIIWILCVVGTLCTLFPVMNKGIPGVKKELRNMGVYVNYDHADMVTEVRCDGLAFNKIDANKVEVYIVKDTVDKVEVSAPATILRSITTSVIDSVLFIDVVKKMLNYDYIRIVVHHSGRIKDVDVNSGAEVNGRMFADSCLIINAESGSEVSLDELNAEGRVDIKAHSGAEVEVERLNASSVNLNLSSGAAVELCGIAQTINVVAGSGASVDLEDLTTDTLYLNLSSGANVKRPRQRFVEISNRDNSSVNVSYP